MKRVFLWLGVILFSVFLFNGLSQSSEKHAKGGLKLAQVSEPGDPRGLNQVLIDDPMAIETFMPLAVGNQWEYEYLVRYVTDAKIPESKRPGSIYGYLFYEKDLDHISGGYAKGYFYSPDDQLTWVEVYKIESKQDDRFYFTVSSNSERKFHRDGRYEDTIESNGQAWLWKYRDYKGNKSHIFTEFMTRPNLNKNLGQQKLVSDSREYISWMTTPEGKWALSEERMYYGSGHDIEQDLGNYTVKVQAGTFENCIKVVETFKGTEQNGHEVYWKNYTFYAPGVGRVYEYQQLPSGTMTYETALKKYSLK